MDYRAGLCDKGVQQQLREVRDHKPERGEFCNASSHSHKTQLLPCTGKAAHLGWFGRKELSGCLGDSCSLRSRAGIKVSHGHAKPSPAPWFLGASIRQAPNVSSCWAGKMILNNSPINRQQRGGTEQEGLSGPFLQRGLRAGSQCNVLPERRQGVK